jgi:hypothetical protein
MADVFGVLLVEKNMIACVMHALSLMGLRGFFVLVFNKNTTVVARELVDLFFCRILTWLA